MIIVNQYPLQLVPSNSTHVWNVSSTLSGLANFKFVFDVWVNKNGWERVSRVKTRPNETGRGIVDLEEIIFNQLVPNPRSEQNQLNGNTVQVLPQGIITNTSGITLSNGYNTSSTYDPLFHTSEYRVAIGEEFLSGGTTVIIMPKELDIVSDTWSGTTHTIYPGASDNKVDFKRYYWNVSGGTSAENMWKDTSVWNHHFNTSGITETNQKRFLNAAGDDYVSVSQNNISLTATTSYARYRKHHPDCPIILSYFNGNTRLFCNDNVRLNIYNSNDGIWNFEQSPTGIRYQLCSTPEPINNRIQHFTYPPDTLGVGFRMFYMSNHPVFNKNYNTYGISEMLIFDYQEPTCFNDAVHILFLNKRGVWDTYSFGTKHIRSLKRTTSTYAQAPNINKQLYNLFSFQQRDVVYDYQVDEIMEATSWYMDENDKSIIEELFLSPYTYIIQDHVGAYSGTNQHFPYLIPIKINTDTWTEFKNQYTKLAQYSFRYTYNPIKEYKLQG